MSDKPFYDCHQHNHHLRTRLDLLFHYKPVRTSGVGTLNKTQRTQSDLCSLYQYELVTAFTLNSCRCSRGDSHPHPHPPSAHHHGLVDQGSAPIEMVWNHSDK